MSLTISHTQNELYKRCPMAWHIRYNLKLNEKVVGSALPFGNAIDSALNELLLTKDVKKSILLFDDKWRNPEINKIKVNGPFTDLIRYSKADLDESLVTNMPDLKQKSAWVSLRIKGEMMLKQYAEQILPQIKEVLAVQKIINIDNGIGDKITGVVDLIAILQDGKTYILDNKTSSSAYNDDAVEKEGHQLSLYNEAIKDEIKIDGQGFIVIEKNLRKLKEPRVKINMILGKAPEELANEVIGSMDATLRGIKSGHFHSKHPECKSYFGPCLCQLHNADNYDQLVYTGYKK